MRLTNTFWPLARPYVVHCISKAPHKHDVGLWNCALGVKPAFSEILPFFKVLVCRNFMWKCIRVTKHRHIYLGAVLLALCVDWIGRFSHTGLENFGHIKYCSIVALKNDHKKHFQGYIVLLSSSFTWDFFLCSSVQLWIQRVFLVMVNFKVLLGMVCSVFLD